MIITILTDNRSSWFIEFGNALKNDLEKLGHTTTYVFDKNDIVSGDVCFLLSCSKLVEQQFLDRNKNNIVVHASDLPKGKGFSPLQWQILAGENNIPLTLFEVVEQADAGPYYYKDNVVYNGHELYEEMRSILGQKIIEMCLYYIQNRDTLTSKIQEGEETFYKRRTRLDDEINPEKSLSELFDHLRIADNDNFPLYFYHKGKKFNLKIYPATD